MISNTPKAVMRIYNGDMKLDDAALTKLFLKQLDNVYCIKNHLVKVLPGIAGKASFPDLKEAILGTVDIIKLQILRMDVIYKICKAKYKNNNCIGVKTLSLEAMIATKADDQSPMECDLSLLIHLQIIESMEIAYFGVLRNIASSLANKEVETLLDQNLESAMDGKKLYELIAKEYIS